MLVGALPGGALNFLGVWMFGAERKNEGAKELIFCESKV